MFSDNSEILKNKLTLLTDVGLRKVVTSSNEEIEPVRDFELAYHTCVTLMKLYQPKKAAPGKDATQPAKLANDHAVIQALVHQINSGTTEVNVKFHRYLWVGL